MSERDKWVDWFDNSWAKEERAFEILVCMLLTNRATDKAVGNVMQTLRLRGLLCVESMSDISRTTLELLIWPVGIQNIKAQNPINMARYLMREEHGIVPAEFKQIKKIRGVGRKIGLVTLYEAYGVNAGIAVDTHLLKIFSALGWVDKKTSANKAGLSVEQWMPAAEWGRMNEIYAGLG